MTIQRYALGTFWESNLYGVNLRGRALCPDGKVRALKRIGTADTFFSIPAAVTYRGKTVTGYISVETIEGSSVPTPDDPAVVKFATYTYGKNAKLWGPDDDNDYGGFYRSPYIEFQEGAERYLTRDGEDSHLRVPCSRYGHNTISCVPVAYAAATILAGETGEPLTPETLDYVMGLVVNDHEDPGYLIREYGRGYGFTPANFLD